MSHPLEDSAVVWANRALISAAAIFLAETLVELSGSPIFPCVISALDGARSNIFQQSDIPGICSTLDKVVLALDTSFQLSYVGIISWRVRVINGDLFAIPLALLGLSSPIINIVVSNPSSFPQCRLLNPGPPARIITILPCLRAAFDAATTLALFTKLLRHVASMGALASHTVSFVLTEETKDIVLIFAIMTIEAVFAQARNHARNFVVPFVDSLTAILATRFMLELEERSRNHGRNRSRGTSRLPVTTTTLVASEAPIPACEECASSLHTFETKTSRSIGWNRIGSCLGARSF
ncbi:hypothetical protein C8R45DRAFT_574016 [Mycena sanguinolenta]|nr:hypothetical protein C8R45DRAFT_574016 [Mycena sanguinolenta]